MNHEEKEKALSKFSSRMQGIVDKTEAAIKDKKIDNFAGIEYEFNRLKQDFQQLSGKCAAHDQGVFQFGQLLSKFESTFNQHNPLNSDCL